MGWTRTIVAIIAMLLLVPFDLLILVAAFLGRPDDGKLLASAVLLGAFVALMLQWRWLLLAAQNLISILTLVRIASLTPTGHDIVQAAAFIGIGNILALAIAQAMPPAGVRRAAAPPPPA